MAFTDYSERKTIAQYFAGCFMGDYDGRQDDAAARRDFSLLTCHRIMWTQAHGDFKDIEKRLDFTPYPHWRELHECCGLVVHEAIRMDSRLQWTQPQAARLMDYAMKVLRKKYGFNAPRWWIPLMNQLRA
jgi:hypothetical protein